MERYYKKWFYLLVLPAVLLFVFVIGLPFVIGTIYSFTSWRGTYFAGGTLSESFVGLENYIQAFSDEQFIHSMIYTTAYTLVAVVAINIVALSFALMLGRIKRGVGLYRTVFFLPNMLGGLAMGFIWQFIFQVVYTDLLFSPDGLFHVEFLRFMTQDTTKALFALVIMTVWQSAGYMMLIYISGLNSIPGELYEAAEIDGAGPIRKFFTVTLPLLMPSITIVLFLTLANSFKLLDQNIALTNGDFNTRLMALQILRTIQDKTPPNYGVAQAQAVVFFVIVAVISLFQVSLTRRKEVEY
ncbi:MAG: sugar ABC transporter permease [Clostridia bacterium]|nr:sugar ABC transporter permease [Clostridia bacterium]MBQ3554414.1 sugar ABC transporter permease [Clostridia bacterium]